MGTNYPDSLDTGTELPDIVSTDLMSDGGLEHDVVHTNVNQAVLALQAKLGIGDTTPQLGRTLLATDTGETTWTADKTFNVVAYGAAGDGITEDTTAVQAAIDAAIAAGNGTVAFPPGIYLVDTLEVDGVCTILGAGVRKTAIIAKTGTTTTLFDVSPSSSVRHVEIGRMGIEMDNAKFINAITISNVNHPYIHDLHIEYGARGVDIASCGNGTFERILIWNPSSAAIRVNGDNGAEHQFQNIQINTNDGATVTAAGFEYVRTTDTDQGGLYLNRVQVTRTAGTVTYGLKLHSSAASTASFVFVNDCVFDNVNGTAAMLIENLDYVFIRQTYCTAGSPASTAVAVDGGQFITFESCWFNATHTFDGAPIDLLYSNNFWASGPALTLPASNGPTRLQWRNNIMATGNIADVSSRLAGLPRNTASHLGLGVITDTSGGAGNSFFIENAQSGTAKHVRVSSGGTYIMYNDALDTALFQVTDAGKVTIAGELELDGVLNLDGAYIELDEQGSDPSAPASDKARIFAKDNGAGKTQLCVRFPTGAVQVLATEP